MHYLGRHGIYRDEILKIQEVCLQNCWEVALHECITIWESYSDSLSAGWIGVSGYTDEELWNIISLYLPKI